MARIKLGEAVTDSNGIAVFEYTGTGSGLMDVRAVNGDVVSEIFVTWDCLWYDIGTSGHKNENWINSDTSTLTVVVDEFGTTLSSTASNKRYYTPNKYTDFVCEFDIVEHTNDWAMFQLGNSSINIRLHEALTDSHVKIWQQDATLYYQIDNGTPTSTTGTSTAYPLVLRCNANDTIKFKDFKIYPI